MHPITALQMEWSLWTCDIEEEIIPLCRYIQFTDDVFFIYFGLLIVSMFKKPSKNTPLTCSSVLDVTM